MGSVLPNKHPRIQRSEHPGKRENGAAGTKDVPLSSSVGRHFDEVGVKKVQNTNPLGQTGLAITQLGFGSMGLRGPNTWGVRVVDEADAERLLNQVLDSGINFIDTAPDYGIAERRIGDYIGHRRSEYVLATKCGCAPIQHEDHLEIRHVWNADVIRRNLEESLARLQTDHIDLLQFHGGDAETLQSQGLIDLLLEFKSEGLIGHLGISAKLPDLEALLQLDVFETVQAPFSCLAPEHADILSRAAARGVGVIVRGGIAHGGPDAEIKRPNLDQVWDDAGLDSLLPSGMARAEFILRHTLSQPFCHTTIVGTSNLKHLAENLASAEAGPLSKELQCETEQRVARAIGQS